MCLLVTPRSTQCLFFFFNDTATTEIYTLSLHDALPISLDVLIDFPLPFEELWTNKKVRQDRNRSEEHTSELQSQSNLVCRLLLEKKKKKRYPHPTSITHPYLPA